MRLRPCKGDNSTGKDVKGTVLKCVKSTHLCESDYSFTCSFVINLIQKSCML